MMYVSTRGGCEPVSSAEAIKIGLAGDGGLFVPDELPELDEEVLEDLCSAPYCERVAKILHMFLCDSFTIEELLECARAAYPGEKFPGGAAPVVALGDRLRVLELWHGPTAAFKDMALQIMPHLLRLAVRKTGEQGKVLILAATSGDTGKAALEGYRDVDGTKIMVFYPAGGVSRVQMLQMATQEGSNVSVQAVRGNFDDTQAGVKRIFASPEIKAELAKRGYILTSANSINWGRLAPQIAYYVSAYCDLIRSGDIKLGEEIYVCVPTGNFGNILAAYIARRMGLPIRRLICASNSNRVLTDFFENGVYDRNREFHLTISPSMDILISSNLERLLWFAAGPNETARYMRQLAETGRYEVDPSVLEEIGRDFVGMSCSEDETRAEIKSIWKHFGYLCDTHTAVGLHCAEQYLEGETRRTNGRKMLAVSTASAYKFASDVYYALTGEVVEGTAAIGQLSSYTGTSVHASLVGIEQRNIRFDPQSAIEADDMDGAVLSFAV
ncbi:MAG: threonine synthase [Eubacteriales bacterium]|nr:threonine synthase [Clostridiales bacterium]